MKGNLIALLMKLAGLGGIWDKIDGTKTYLGASATILSGLGGILLAASTLASSFVENTHSLGDVVNFIQGQFAHPSPQALAITLGWAAVLRGWEVMAKKSAEDKKHAELLASQAAAAAPVVDVKVVPMAPEAKAPDAPAAP